MAPDIHIDHFVNGDPINQTGSHNTGKQTTYNLWKEASTAPSKRTILVLMSNPRGTARLELDEEYRVIDQAVVAGQLHERLDLRPGLAVRHDDLQGLLSQHKPAVMHFSGHNSAEAGIMLADNQGNARPVAPDAISDLFAIVAASIRCVVLNACLTEAQAEAIAAHVPCAIGMSRAVLDSTAIAFAAAFYRAVADGESVGRAFRLGCNRLGFDRSGTYRDLAPVSGGPIPQHTIPVLLGDRRIADQTFITS